MRIRRTANAIVTGSILAAIIFGGMSFVRPIPVLDAGVCSDLPVGYYRLGLVDFEEPTIAGDAVRIGGTRGNTFTMLDYLIFGRPICTGTA